MGKLITSSNKKCIRYNEYTTFSHSIGSDYIPNQNPNDFGFIYFYQNGYHIIPSATLIYDFDKYCYYDGNNNFMKYLCDDYGNQYDFTNSESYNSFNSRKLIHESDFKYIDLDPGISTYNNCGQFFGLSYSSYNNSSSFGGGLA